MALRDRMPLHWQGWISEAEDELGMWVARLGRGLETLGLQISARANDRWHLIQPRIAEAVRDHGACPVCGRYHDPER